MLRLLACVVLVPVLAQADSEPAFDEKYVCTNERSASNEAANYVRDAPRRSPPEWSVARRDKTAKTLAECVSRERLAHESRVEAKRAEVETKAKEQERLRALMSSRPTLHVALSAKLCVDAVGRAAAIREIAAEKKYARYGGYENKAKLYELQQDIRDFDERKVEWLKALKNLKLKALGCTSGKVKPVTTCQAATTDGPCAVADVAGAIEAASFLEFHGIGPLAQPDAYKNVTPGP